jgi:hypothetical protein
MQHTVDAVADAKLVRQRFKVNVRRALLERFDDQRVYQLDDGGVRIDDSSVVRAHRPRFADLDFTLGDVLDHLVELPGAAPWLAAATTAAVITIQRFLNLIGRRDAGLNRHIEGVTEAVQCVEVRRIRDRDRDSHVVDLVNGDSVELFGDVARDSGDDVIRQLHFREVDILNAEIRGFGLCDAALACATWAVLRTPFPTSVSRTPSPVESASFRASVTCSLVNSAMSISVSIKKSSLAATMLLSQVLDSVQNEMCWKQ